jgi:hypothetical protein
MLRSGLIVCVAVCVPFAAHALQSKDGPTPADAQNAQGGSPPAAATAKTGAATADRKGAAGWKLPPQTVVDVLDAAPTPDAMLSPDARWMLMVERPAMPSIAEVTRPWIGLAGTRVDPALRAPHTTSSVTGLVLRNLDGSRSQRIVLPQDARVLDVSWSHASDRFAFTVVGENGLELWVAGVRDGAPATAGRLAARYVDRPGVLHWSFST